MRLYVLLQILRTLERLTAEIALMRLQRHVHANVRSDVVALDRGGAAVSPLARQIQVVGALATDMSLADVVLGVLLASDGGCDEEGTRSPREKTSTRCMHDFSRERRGVQEKLT